jgi:hypothetical protein
VNDLSWADIAAASSEFNAHLGPQLVVCRLQPEATMAQRLIDALNRGEMMRLGSWFGRLRGRWVVGKAEWSYPKRWPGDPSLWIELWRAATR